MNGTDHKIDSISSATNPFPGLRSFDVYENYLFFGRDKQVDALLKKLTDNRFVGVVGSSGSGKSSLVRAGLLPVLYGGFMANAGSSWRVAIFRPGGNPIYNMAAALNAPDVFGTDDEEANAVGTTITATTLESSSLGLIQVVRQARIGEGENLLLVVDQFEELFRFKENAAIADAANQAAAFVKLLLEAVHQKELPIYVVMTVRSDFLGDCAQYRDLPEAINDGQFLIPRLRREQHREAIVGPVAVGGGKMAPRLVQQLLNDVGDNPDQLPILQHALMRTWDHWVASHAEGEPIDIRHYEEIGGMSKALSQHADEAYNDLPDDRSRKVCEILFKCLTMRGSDNRGIRRPTRVKEVCAIAEATPEEVIAVVERFRQPGRSFIMPPHGVPLTPDTMLDISHESLMRVWERLEKWVDEDAISAAMYIRLVESSALHENQQASVWRDPELQEAVNWRDANHPNEAWGKRYDPHWTRSMKFLDESLRQRDLELRDKKRRRFVANSLIAAFLVFAGVLSVWALSERSSAKMNAAAAFKEQQLAEEQRKLAQEQSWKATHSAELAENQKQEAEREKLEAEKQKKIAEQKGTEALAQKRRAEHMSEEAIAASNVATSEQKKALLQKLIADSLKTLAEQSADKVEHQRLLSIAKAIAVKAVQLQKSGSEDLAALLSLQAFDFNRNNGGSAFEPDVFDALRDVHNSLSGEEDILKAHRGGVRSAAFIDNGKILFTAGSDGKLIRWALDGGAPRPVTLLTEPFGIRCIACSADNSLLAYAGSDPGIRILRVKDPSAAPMIVPMASKQVVDIAFLPDGGHLVALGTDGAAHVFNLAGGKSEHTLSFNEKILTLAVAENGMIAAGGDNGGIAIWQPDYTGEADVIFKDGKSAVQSLAFSSASRSLAAGYVDGIVRLWNPGDQKSKAVELITRKSPVHSVAFNAAGDLLVTGSSDGRVRLWNVARPNDAPVTLSEHDGWVWSVNFSPDGATVVSTSADRTGRVLPTRPDRIADAVRTKMTRNLTKKEWDQYVGTDIPYQKTCPQLSAGTD